MVAAPDGVRMVTLTVAPLAAAAPILRTAMPRRVASPTCGAAKQDRQVFQARSQIRTATGSVGHADRQRGGADIASRIGGGGAEQVLAFHQIHIGHAELA
ncbi:hypothetical protein LP419_39260 [Massilia sp. H-1]|nr:hypothetical protein LP419_39260 [Massilia sp. H-1]